MNRLESKLLQYNMGVQFMETLLNNIRKVKPKIKDRIIIRINPTLYKKVNLRSIYDAIRKELDDIITKVGEDNFIIVIEPDVKPEKVVVKNFKLNVSKY
jgi:hypothetical protein